MCEELESNSNAARSGEGALQVVIPDYANQTLFHRNPLIHGNYFCDQFSVFLIGSGVDGFQNGLFRK